MSGTLENLANELSKQIFDAVDDKLQPQYRESKDPDYRFNKSGLKTKIQLTSYLRGTIVNCFVAVATQYETIGRKEVELMYKNFIPKPKGNTAQRWKFLLTGKL